VDTYVTRLVAHAADETVFYDVLGLFIVVYSVNFGLVINWVVLTIVVLTVLAMVSDSFIAFIGFPLHSYH